MLREFEAPELYQGLNPWVLKILAFLTMSCCLPHPTHLWPLFPVGPDDSHSFLADIVVFDNVVNKVISMLLLLLLLSCHCPHVPSPNGSQLLKQELCSKYCLLFGFIVFSFKEHGPGSPGAEPRSFKQYVQLSKKKSYISRTCALFSAWVFYFPGVPHAHRPWGRLHSIFVWGLKPEYQSQNLVLGALLALTNVMY